MADSNSVQTTSETSSTGTPGETAGVASDTARADATAAPLIAALDEAMEALAPKPPAPYEFVSLPPGERVRATPSERLELRALPPVAEGYTRIPDPVWWLGTEDELRVRLLDLEQCEHPETGAEVTALVVVPERATKARAIDGSIVDVAPGDALRIYAPSCTRIALRVLAQSPEQVFPVTIHVRARSPRVVLAMDVGNQPRPRAEFTPKTKAPQAA